MTVTDVWSALVDLVLPAGCAGCGATGGSRSVCRDCAAAFAAAVPARVRPEPEPPGLPRCMALAAYAGALRSAILDYKERGRFTLAGPLGDRLGDVVLAGLAGQGSAGAAVVLVPVPATTAAARRRYGDHMTRLARRAASRLRGAGCPAEVAHPLRARPRPDSAGLTGAERARLAAEAFTLAPRRVAALRGPVARGARLVLVDDVVTTGATLAAAARRLRGAGLGVYLAATLAATQRTRSAPPTLSSSHRTRG